MVGRGKKTKNVTKKNLSKIAVQDSESHDEDIDIITMHNNSGKSKKTPKTVSGKKSQIENDKNNVGKKSTNSLNKIKSTKSNVLKKKKRSPVDEDESIAKTTSSTGKVTKGEFVYK